MDQSIIFVSKPRSLQNTACKDKHGWEEQDEDRIFQTNSKDKSIYLVSDRLPVSVLKSKFDNHLSRMSEFAIVYHTDMIVAKEVILDWTFKAKRLGCELGQHDPDRGQTKDLKTELYNLYLNNILKSCDDNGFITDESFKSLWKIFEKKSELELALESLHSDWSSINFNDDSAADAINELVVKRNVELNTLLK